MRKLLLICILHSFLLANNYPKWAPIMMDDIVIIIPTYIQPQVVVDTHTITDTTGKRPSNVVDAFIKAFLADDKDKVSELLGANAQLLALLYDNPDATTFLKGIYGHTYKIGGKHQVVGDASVTISFVDDGTHHKGGFELIRSNENKWIIKFFY